MLNWISYYNNSSRSKCESRSKCGSSLVVCFCYLYGVKKPTKSSIRAHVTRMETLNKYLGLLPTIKNSPQAVASTELGNVPFNETTLASIILNHLPVAWRTQYALTHTLVPESPRAILLDLENIENFPCCGKTHCALNCDT